MEKKNTNNENETRREKRVRNALERLSIYQNISVSISSSKCAVLTIADKKETNPYVASKMRVLRKKY